MFWHVFAKIPRHTRKNAITEGDLECILTSNCEGTEQLQIKSYFKEETIMTGTVKNYATASIFGAYILRMREIPGRKIVDELKEKKAERERFEVIDDYVEQA